MHQVTYKKPTIDEDPRNECTCLTLGGVPPSWLCPIHGEAQRKRDEKYPYKSTLPPNGAGGRCAWE